MSEEDFLIRDKEGNLDFSEEVEDVEGFVEITAIEFCLERTLDLINIIKLLDYLNEKFKL